MCNLKKNMKSITLLMTVFTMLAMLAGCGHSNSHVPKNNNEVFTNAEYANSGMMAINWNAFDYKMV